MFLRGSLVYLLEQGYFLTHQLLHYSVILHSDRYRAVTLISLLKRQTPHFTCVQSILAAQDFYAYGVAPECKTTPQHQNF